MLKIGDIMPNLYENGLNFEVLQHLCLVPLFLLPYFTEVFALYYLFETFWVLVYQ